MKTSLVVVVFAIAACAASGQTTPQGQAPAAKASSSAPVIKDPAEYNAYMSAAQQKDNNAKISEFEAFLVQYPNSVMKQDVLETLMGLYEQTKNQAKMVDAANRILQANPNNVRALALLAYSDKGSQNWPDARKYAEQGLNALPGMTKPEGLSDADFAKQKEQLGQLLNSVAGFASLQTKDFPAAQKYLRASVDANPNNLQDVYPLALAYLTATPPDNVNGLFFIARAAVLAAGTPNAAQLETYGKGVYTKYHGSDQGWTDVMATAKTNPLPPSGFTVAQYVPPTPAQQAHDLVKDKMPDDIKKMSFAEWELVLSAGQQEDADKVWNVIKGLPLQMEGWVIKASPTELDIAGSDDDNEAKRADISLTMTGPIPERLMPKEGATFDFEGTPSSYVPSPFVMTMDNGKVLTKAAPAKKKPPVHRRRPH
ncbi:MAG: tetratricopeptide repeat protein [Terriglobales bacterium]